MNQQFHIFYGKNVICKLFFWKNIWQKTNIFLHFYSIHKIFLWNLNFGFALELNNSIIQALLLTRHYSKSLRSHFCRKHFLHLYWLRSLKLTLNLWHFPTKLLKIFRHKNQWKDYQGAKNNFLGVWKLKLVSKFLLPLLHNLFTIYMSFSLILKFCNINQVVPILK